jgi:hypothetical protein
MASANHANNHISEAPDSLLFALQSCDSCVYCLVSFLAAMSLPGLELTQPSEERQQVTAPPSQITLNPNCEWRFEVAFGHIIKVKVCDVFSTR